MANFLNFELGLHIRNKKVPFDSIKYVVSKRLLKPFLFTSRRSSFVRRESVTIGVEYFFYHVNKAKMLDTPDRVDIVHSGSCPARRQRIQSKEYVVIFSRPARLSAKKIYPVQLYM